MTGAGDHRYVLAIEASNPTCGRRGAVMLGGSRALAGSAVALGRVDDDGAHTLVDAELLSDGPRDDDLLPAIDRLCLRVGARGSSIVRVGVSVGPGGYTGLRVAVTAASVIAAASGATVHGVRTACVAAWAALLEGVTPNDGAVVVCLASKRGEVFASVLREGGAADVEDVGLVGLDGLSALRPGVLVADAHLPDAMRGWAADAGVGVLEPKLCAEAVLELSGAVPGKGPGEVAPLYPREPEAVTRWRALHG